MTTGNGSVDGPVDGSTFLESRGNMKSFYSPAVEALDAPAAVDSSPVIKPVGVVCYIPSRARIAVYDALSVAPRILEVEPAPVAEFIQALATRVYELCRAAGGSIPFTVIREVAENFIHANFAEPVVSILDSGTTVRFADRGPGIVDKDRALLPGFTTAGSHMKGYIRGVGSGLPVVRDYLIHSGGSLAIEDNLGTGSVVTLYSGPQKRDVVPVPTQRAEHGTSDVYALEQQFSFGSASEPSPIAPPRLTARQKQVLALVLESGLAGPSLVSKELGVGVSTAYRDLAMLEDFGLIASDSGKRTLTPRGLSYLSDLMNRL